MTGDFTVRSAYKLLQIGSRLPTDNTSHAYSRHFYKKLWNLQIPPKIKTTIWRFSWNFIPTFVNLNYRRIAVNTL